MLQGLAYLLVSLSPRRVHDLDITKLCSCCFFALVSNDDVVAMRIRNSKRFFGTVRATTHLRWENLWEDPKDTIGKILTVVTTGVRSLPFADVAHIALHCSKRLRKLSTDTARD
jgi:hypothetical protein